MVVEFGGIDSIMSAAYVLANPFPLTGNETVDVTTNGYKWYFPAGVPRVLNWSVSSSLWTHPTLQSAETQADFARAFEYIQEFINVQFNFLGYINGTNGLTGYENAYLTGSDLNITYAFNGKTSSGTTLSDGKFTTNSQTAFCYFPDLDYNSKYLGAAGDTFLNYNNSFLANASFENGTSSFALLLHEILHGLGLKHPHDSGGTGRPTYTKLGMKFADRQWISIMSYDLYENGGDGAYSGSQPIGPMLLDAIALQYLYGESTFNSGDTIYDLNRYLGNYYNCQWDASGTDLLDAGNLTYGVVVELDGGQASNGLNLHHIGFITTALDYLVLSLTNPTKWTWLWGEYENINGSPYDDIISGNDLDNIINGGSGNDLLSGGSGDDTFDWDVSLRGGDDTFAGGQGNDIYVLNSIRDIVIEESFEGVDTVFVGFNYSIVNTAIENVKAFNNQTSAVTFTGNSWTNVLEGGLGNDSLYGGEGSDTLKGGLGNDLIDGGQDIDYAVFSSPISDLSFKANGSETIVTTKGEGTDTLRNVEFIRASGSDYKLSNILTNTLPTYSFTTTSSYVNEGSTATFTVTTTNVATGTYIPYIISGVSASDIVGGSLAGTIIVGSNGQASIHLQVAADQTTEGNEVLTVTIQGKTASITIVDTSVNKGPADKDLVYVFKSEKTGAGVNPASYSYFYTVDAAEANYIKGQASWPWVQKAATFEAAHSNPLSSVPVFRFWSDKHQSHFFTINSAEKDQIINWSMTGINGYDWKFEGEGFRVYVDGTTTDDLNKFAIPVYRLWMDDKDFNAANGLSGGHFFTADKSEYDSMIKLVGVKGEGIAFYGEPPGG